MPIPLPSQFEFPHDTIPNFLAVPTLSTRRSGTWSDSAIWDQGRLPGPADRMSIDHTVVGDASFMQAFVLSIGPAGRLLRAPDRSTRLEYWTMQILEGGRYEIGADAGPLWPSGFAEDVFVEGQSPVPDPKQFGGGLLCYGDMIVRAPRRTPYGQLTGPAEVGHTILNLRNPVSGWLPGDRLALTLPLSLYEERYEECLVASVAADGLRVALRVPLHLWHPRVGTWNIETNGHMASPNTLVLDTLPSRKEKFANWNDQTGAEDYEVSFPVTWHVGEYLFIGSEGGAFITALSADRLTVTLDRSLPLGGPALPIWRYDPLNVAGPFVLNLSRNVLFRSANQESHRGHVLWTHCAFPDIQGASFINGGRTRADVLPSQSQRGRYSAHLHHVYGQRGKPYVARLDSCTFENSLAWGLAVHATCRSRIENNIFFGFDGSGLAIEDGNGRDNVIRNNFALMLRPGYYSVPAHGRTHAYFMPHDHGSNGGVTGSGFWVEGMENFFEDNIAYGCEQTVFWGGHVTVTFNPQLVGTTPSVGDPPGEPFVLVNNLRPLASSNWQAWECYMGMEAWLGGGPPGTPGLPDDQQSKCLFADGFLAVACQIAVGDFGYLASGEGGIGEVRGLVALGCDAVIARQNDTFSDVRFREVRAERIGGGFARQIGSGAPLPPNDPYGPLWIRAGETWEGIYTGNVTAARLQMGERHDNTEVPPDWAVA